MFSRCEVGVTRAPMEVGEHRSPRVGTEQPGRGRKAVDYSEAGRCPPPIADSDGAVQRVQRRRRHAIEQLVALDDAVPPCLPRGGRETVLGSDSGLGVVPGEDGPLGRASQPGEPHRNAPLVPEGAVLLLEEQEATAPVLSGGHARLVQVHEGQQRERLWGGAERMGRQDRREPPGFLEITPDRVVGVRGEVAFREERVEDRLHGREPRGELLVREIGGEQGRLPRRRSRARPSRL